MEAFQEDIWVSTTLEKIDSSTTGYTQGATWVPTV
jgi:hypothetical protein